MDHDPKARTQKNLVQENFLLGFGALYTVAVGELLPTRNSQPPDFASKNSPRIRGLGSSSDFKNEHPTGHLQTSQLSSQAML